MFNFKSINYIHSPNYPGIFFRLLVGNVMVCLCVDRDTLLSLCSLEWRGKSSRNNVARCICVYGHSCRSSGQGRSESDEFVRGRTRRLPWFPQHTDLAGCVTQHKINTNPAWKSINWFCTVLSLIGKILTKVIPSLCEIFNCLLFPVSLKPLNVQGLK